MPPVLTAIKCEMLFQADAQQSGWSEVYWLNQALISQAESALDNMAPARLQMLAANVTLLGYRITAPLIPPGPGYLRAQRSAYLAERNLKGGGKIGSNTAQQSLIGIMCRLSDLSQSVFKNQVYRGVSDSLWSNGGDKVAQAGFATWGPKWQQILRTNGVCIRHATRAVPAFNFQQIQYVEYRRMDYRKAGRSFETLRGRR